MHVFARFNAKVLDTDVLRNLVYDVMCVILLIRHLSAVPRHAFLCVCCPCPCSCCRPGPASLPVSCCRPVFSGPLHVVSVYAEQFSATMSGRAQVAAVFIGYCPLIVKRTLLVFNITD